MDEGKVAALNRSFFQCDGETSSDLLCSSSRYLANIWSTYAFHPGMLADGYKGTRKKKKVENSTLCLTL